MKSYLKLIRLNHPTGIFLLFLPCTFGITLAAKKMPVFQPLLILFYIFLFFVGSVIMRSAGCIINDMIDQKFDKKVDRTKNRPLVSGEISFIKAGLFLSILLTLGLVILMQFNQKTIISGFVALLLVITYPVMKRITYYPQVFLGFTFNFGILMAGFALLNQIDAAFILLYISTILWTVIYDTIYAFQDIEDDLKIGVKSTAIKFSKNPKTILTTLNFAMFLILAILGKYSDFQPIFFFIILGISFLLDYQISKCDWQNPQTCLKAFKSNIWIGILILLALITG